MIKKTKLIIFVLFIFSLENCFKPKKSSNEVPLILYSRILNQEKTSKNTENQLKSISINEIKIPLSIDDTSKKVVGFLGYNPKNIDLLKKEITINFEISNKATLKISDKKINSNQSKLKLNYNQDSFSISLDVISESGVQKTYNLKINIIGKDIDKNFLPEGYYPTHKYIGVYRTKESNKQQLDRVYKDMKTVMDKLDEDIKFGLIKSGAKLIVAKDEDEVISDDYYISIVPLEAIYSNNSGKDETLPDSDTGISTTKLEFTYLTVYYSLLIEDSLSDKYSELKAAYKEAADKSLFKIDPDGAYADGYDDPLHQNASNKKALKYGSFMFNTYKVYFAKDGSIKDVSNLEYKIKSKAEMQQKTPLAYKFIKDYYDKN